MPPTLIHFHKVHSSLPPFLSVTSPFNTEKPGFHHLPWIYIICSTFIHEYNGFRIITSSLKGHFPTLLSSSCGPHQVSVFRCVFSAKGLNQIWNFLWHWAALWLWMSYHVSENLSFSINSMRKVFLCCFCLSHDRVLVRIKWDDFFQKLGSNYRNQK